MIEEQQKLVIALSQIEDLTSLLEDNEYKSFLYNRLIPVKYELQRQLANLTKTPLYPTIDE
jgi:hypothetical protein